MSEFPTQHSRNRAGPGFIQNVNASNSVFNQVGRDQYNINNMNNEMVADAYLDKLSRAVGAGYSSGNHKPCLHGTREGVLLDIETWEADKSNESVYWLKGVAGCGKSTIAQTFAERSAANGNLGASFFCSRDYLDRRNLRLIFPTLAYDLAYWSPDFKTALVPIIRANPDVQYDSLPVQLEKLLVRPFKQTGLSTTIVIDALDECEDKEPVSEFLSALALHVDKSRTIKFFITGRPEERIRYGFKLPSLRTKELPLHDVESTTVDSDIKSFLQARLKEIATRRSASIAGQWPSDQDIATILKKASGLFIIASVIVRFIDYPHTPQQRLKLIVDLPDSTIYEGKSGVDVVYHQILTASFEDVDEDDGDFFDQLSLVIGSIVLALQPLSRTSLAGLLEITSNDLCNILTHLHSVLIVPESEWEPIRIIHKSFADFITDDQRCPDGKYRINGPLQHSELVVRCLLLMNKGLTKNICHLPPYAMNADVEDLPARRERYIGAPLSYACSSWAKHLQLSPKAGNDTGTIFGLVKDFFTHRLFSRLNLSPKAVDSATTTLELVRDFFVHHLLSWLEVLSTEGNLHIAIYSLRYVRSWLNDTPDKGLLDLIDDCERFILRSFDGIEQSAMHIYHSALSWAPISSRTRKLYKRELINEAKLGNAVGTDWDACIRIIPVGKTARGVAFSSMGAFVAVYGNDFVKVFDTMTGMNRATVDEDIHIESVAFSPDDALLALGLSAGTINIWDVQTGTLFRTFKNGIGSVCSVSFSPRGTMIASGGSDRNVRIWSISSAGCDHIFQGHSGKVRDICWLTEEQVMSGSDDRMVRVWDIRRKTRSKIFARYTSWVLALESSLGRVLVASTDGTVEIYDSQSGDIIQTISSGSLIQTRFSIDGDKILLACRDSGYIWDLTRRRRLWSIDYNGDYARFSPDGTRVASIYGNFLKIWKTNAGYKHRKAATDLCQSIKLDNNVLDIALSPDGSQLVSLSPHFIKLWDLEKKCSIAYLPFSPSSRTGRISFAIDGKSILFKDIGDTQSWRIYNIGVSTKRRFFPHSQTETMVFVPIVNSNQDASAPSQSYHFHREWILDQHGRHVLWIPPDERPRRSQRYEHGSKVVVETESGKLYVVDFSLSLISRSLT